MYTHSVGSNVYPIKVNKILYLICRYLVELGDNSKTIPHDDSNSDVSRVSTTFNNLEPGKSYIVTVKCRIQGTDCTGITPTFSVSTKNCSGKFCINVKLIQCYTLNRNTALS